MKVRKIKEVQEPAYKMNVRKKRVKRALRSVKYLLVIALFITTAAYAALSPFFNIKNIVADESVNYDKSTLTGATGILKGQNGFRLLFEGSGKFYLLRIGTAERSIMESCPYVKDAKVRYIIPSTISIEVEEREAAAVLNIGGSDLLIDKEGYLLEIDPEIEAGKLPVIKGARTDRLKPGKKLDLPEEFLLSAFKVFDTIGEVDEMNQDKLLASVDYVDVGDLFNVRLSLQSRVIVNLGGLDDLHYKINAARTIFKSNIKKTERGKLDFSSDANPVFTPESGG